MKYYLAIDIGASSGRHIMGWRENGEIKTEEVYRFPNGVHEADGHLIWNTKQLLTEVKIGIAAAKEKYPRIESLSIDLGSGLRPAAGEMNRCSPDMPIGTAEWKR